MVGICQRVDENSNDMSKVAPGKVAEFGENGKSDKNDKSGEKSPSRVRENSKFKKDVQRGILDFGAFDEHGEYSENGEFGQNLQKIQ